MKAAVYTRPGQIELQDLPTPCPEANRVLVRVRASGVCGSDLDGFLGKTKKRIPPLVLGHEFCGEVVETGRPVAVYPLVPCGACRYCQNDRHHICPNRKVFGLDFHGAFAEYVSAPAQCLFPMPPHMSYVEGALVEPLANAIHALNRCPAPTGLSGVVFGAGPIGMFTFWAAKHFGASPMAVVDLNPNRLSKLEALGADRLIDASREDPVQAILDWTGGLGVDFAVDAVGSSECRASSVRSIAPGATAVWIGLSGDDAEIDGRAIVTREIEIKGSYAYGFEDFRQAISILGEKTFPVENVVSRSRLTEAQSIFENLATGKTGFMKVVFEL